MMKANGARTSGQSSEVGAFRSKPAWNVLDSSTNYKIVKDESLSSERLKHCLQDFWKVVQMWNSNPFSLKSWAILCRYLLIKCIVIADYSDNTAIKNRQPIHSGKKEKQNRSAAAHARHCGPGKTLILYLACFKPQGKVTSKLLLLINWCRETQRTTAARAEQQKQWWNHINIKNK